MDVEYINYNEGSSLLDWLELVNAIGGHQMPKAQVQDTFIYREDTLYLLD